ncbi:MAG: hypothetical protein EOO88_39240 [Pedobacter sp.]|nr:MAG: hypothetical protein EOO88_39240 [Pedobacter sp.]
MYALVFGLLLISSGRTFIEHLIFATYFIAFLLLFLLLETFIIILPIQWLFSQGTWVNSLDALVSVLSLVVVAVYLFLAFRRFYRTSVLWSVLAALASSGTFFIIVVTYRLLLFYKIVRFGH